MKESNLHSRFVRATRFRYANRAKSPSLCIPGRIRTRDTSFVVWRDIHFPTGTQAPWHVVKDQGVATVTGFEPAPAIVTGWCSTVELYGLALGCRDSNPDQLVNSQRPCRWATPDWWRGGGSNPRC